MTEGRCEHAKRTRARREGGGGGILCWCLEHRVKSIWKGKSSFLFEGGERILLEKTGDQGSRGTQGGKEGSSRYLADKREQAWQNREREKKDAAVEEVTGKERKKEKMSHVEV